MPKTSAELKADAKYREKQKRVLICFSKDDPTLEKLRAMVSKDSELPALIKRMLEQQTQSDLRF